MAKRNNLPASAPHNLEIERALLCSCLIDPDAVAQVYDRLNARMFYDRRHQIIFDSIITLFSRGSEIDIITLSDYLVRTRRSEQVGGDPFLASLSSEVATSVHAVHYADRVKEYHTLRELLIIMKTKMHEIAQGEDDSQTISDSLISEVSNINSDLTSSITKDFSEIAKDVVKEIEELMNTEEDDRYKDVIKTGIPYLDRWLGGIRPGRMYMVASSPKVGKTDTICNWSLNFSKTAPVGIISAEMKGKALGLRMLASLARVDSKNAEFGTLTQSQFNKFEKMLQIHRNPIIINDKSAPTAPFVRSQAITMQAQRDIKVLIIDHLQEFKFHTKSSDDHKKWADVTHDLRNIARDLDIAVVLNNQLLKTVRQMRRAPMFGDVKGGEEESDAVILLSPYPLKKKKGIPERLLMDLCAQRYGPTGKVLLMYEKESGHQGQLEWEDMTNAEKKGQSEPESEPEPEEEKPENEELPF
jgi:replicative DNA helicase